MRPFVSSPSQIFWRSRKIRPPLLRSFDTRHERSQSGGHSSGHANVALFFAVSEPAKLAFSASACCDLIGKVSGEITVIACLQFGPLPIFAGKNATAIGRAAFAFHFVAVVVRHAPIMGQFFPSTNIANADERNFTAQAEVGVAGMITVERGTLPFCLGNRRDE